MRGKRIEEMNACIGNLEAISAAKATLEVYHRKTNGQSVTAAEIANILRDENRLKCPAGGVYTLNPIGKEPTCSISNHVIP